MFDKLPEKIIWCYSEFPREYAELTQHIPQIEFIEGIPDNICDRLKGFKNGVLVIDDQMEKICEGNSFATEIFTKKSHHVGFSVILLVQNLFYKGLRSISLNCHYVCLFKQVRDRSQSTTLGKQMFPGNVKFFNEAYMDATREPYSYLFVDCHPATAEEYRLRAQIFPDETNYCYIKK